MIGSSNYVENIPPPTIIISDDEALNNNNIHNRPTLTLYSDEQNNNYQVIDSPATIEYCSSRSDQINGNFLCLSNNVLNLDEIPISALRSRSRDLLSKRLNPIKVILSENGAPRDWRGVLNSIGMSDDVNSVQQKQDEMKEVLDLWMKKPKTVATIGKLQTILGHIDRWDVVDDTNDYFVEDAKSYLNGIAKQRESKGVDQQTKMLEMKECSAYDESELLTHDDVLNANNDKPPQRYDAYLLFDSDNDINFATEILTKMEGEYNLKLCLKERDLIGGTFESDAIMRMISERCDRLIVIFSSTFFDSVANTFFVKFAQALGIEQRKRKIIPCMNENCTLPTSLQYYFILRYREPTPYFNFWHRLYQSIQTVPPINRNPTPKIIISGSDNKSSVAPIESQPQPQHATYQNESGTTPNTISQKRKDKSKSPKSSSPSTPTSLKKLWNNFPKIGSQSTISSSMWTLGVTDNLFDKENERCHSSLSLNNSINSSTTPTKYKKTKWFKKLLSPSSAKLSAESDSSVGTENTAKKKKWYRKRFRSRSKNREAAVAAAAATANEV